MVWPVSVSHRKHLFAEQWAADAGVADLGQELEAALEVPVVREDAEARCTASFVPLRYLRMESGALNTLRSQGHAEKSGALDTEQRMMLS